MSGDFNGNTNDTKPEHDRIAPQRHAAFNRMSASVSRKKALDQAGVLAGWPMENEQWRPYRGSAEIAQCSHPDRTQSNI